MTNYQTKIDATVDSMQNEIITFVQKLVQSPSVANDEGPVQSIILDKLESIGLKAEKVPVLFDELKGHQAFNDDGYSPDSRFNVLGHWENNGGGKSLILNGHVDVVPTGSLELWDESPWSGAIKNGRIYGRGSCDMKAGLASGIFAPFTTGAELETVIFGILILLIGLGGGILIFIGNQRESHSKIFVLIGLTFITISLFLMFVIAKGIII